MIRRSTVIHKGRIVIAIERENMSMGRRFRLRVQVNERYAGLIVG